MLQRQQRHSSDSSDSARYRMEPWAAYVTMGIGLLVLYLISIPTSLCCPTERERYNTFGVKTLICGDCHEKFRDPTRYTTPLDYDEYQDAPPVCRSCLYKLINK